MVETRELFMNNWNNFKYVGTFVGQDGLLKGVAIPNQRSLTRRTAPTSTTNIVVNAPDAL